jgi:hypothetical protein
MRLYIKVIPRSSQEKIEIVADQELKVWMPDPPVGGAANEKLIKMLAAYYHTAKSNIHIVGGKTCRRKIVDVII